MLIKKVLPLAIASALLAGALSASADEVSANVSLLSDYTFRGVSQTDEKGAIQGGFDFAADNGVYVGIWASNVNFGGDASTEMDYYGGFSGETGGGMGWDVGFIYYDYEGDSEFDYLELQGNVSFGDLTVGLNYSDEFGDGGPSFFYPYANYSYSLADNYSLDLHLGYTDLDEKGVFEEGEDSYADWSVGVGTSFMDIDVSLTYVDTTIDDLDAADSRIVFAISKSM